MSRSRKSKSYRSWWNKESAYERRFYSRRLRFRARRAIRNGNFDLMPIRKGTEGWNTW